VSGLLTCNHLDSNSQQLGRENPTREVRPGRILVWGDKSFDLTHRGVISMIGLLGITFVRVFGKKMGHEGK